MRNITKTTTGLGLHGIAGLLRGRLVVALVDAVITTAHYITEERIQTKGKAVRWHG